MKRQRELRKQFWWELSWLITPLSKLIFLPLKTPGHLTTSHTETAMGKELSGTIRDKLGQPKGGKKVRETGCSTWQSQTCPTAGGLSDESKEWEGLWALCEGEGNYKICSLHIPQYPLVLTSESRQNSYHFISYLFKSSAPPSCLFLSALSLIRIASWSS